jgi:hypothetical protein
MATTYSSSAVASTVQAKTELGVNIVKGSYALTGALVVNDVIKMVKVPSGAIIHSIFVGVPDLDSDGTPAVTLSVGDGDSASRFVLDSTVGQATGVIVGPSVAGGVGYAYTADDTIDIKVTTAPDTSATTGTITMTVAYTMNNA